MEKFNALDINTRQLAFEETAARKSLRSTIIEKDFWVCWTLQKLFTNPDLCPHLTFKGGTSLSKGYNLIHRFSEDIDLTISKNAPFVVDCPSPLEGNIGSNERRRRTDQLKAGAQKFLREIAIPVLRQDITSALGGSGWQLILDEKDRDGQTVLFEYPKMFDYTDGDETTEVYIRPHIKLEFGARGDIEPNEMRSIRPYVADEFSQLFDEPNSNISTLSAIRTFFEKATILHALHHGSKLSPRMSRHYYDTCMMVRGGILEMAQAESALLASVVENKSILFRDSKASYETAIFGTLMLVPPESIIAALKDDYSKMDEMFMGEYPSFDEILDELAKAQEILNSAGQVIPNQT